MKEEVTEMYLIQLIDGKSYNVFNGTEEKCETERARLIANGATEEVFYISLNQFD